MSFNKSPVVVCVFILIAFLLVSCGDDNPTDSGTAVSMRNAPEITGIYVTNVNGDIEAILGVPSGPGHYSNSFINAYPYQKPGDPPDPGDFIPRSYYFGIPHPNPFSEEIYISYGFSKATDCKIWVVRGYFASLEAVPGVTESNLGVGAVHVNYAPGVVVNGYHQAGSYGLKLVFKDNGVVLYPYGFYRVYLQTNDFLDWADIYFTTEDIAEIIHD